MVICNTDITRSAETLTTGQIIHAATNSLQVDTFFIDSVKAKINAKKWVINLYKVW